MSTALRIAHGAFGRVALLDMDQSLVRHAHPHCHVLLKVEGADTQFAVGEKVYPLTSQTAVLVNGWQPHSYLHVPARPRTLILALYIEPDWLTAFRPGWAAGGRPGFFNDPSGEVSPRIRSLAMNLAADLMARFARDVMAGRWHGKQSIWVAPEEPGGEITPFPAGFDHLRSIPVRLQEAKTSGEAPQRETASS